MKLSTSQEKGFGKKRFEWKALPLLKSGVDVSGYKGPPHDREEFRFYKPKGAIDTAVPGMDGQSD